MINKAVFSSDKQDWETPPYLFNYFNRRFHFTLDACANDLNHKCDKYFTEIEDGLKQSWERETVWVNPPYSSFQKDWIRKAHREYSSSEDTTVVMLLPARTDTKIFHDYIFYEAKEIYFLKGRIKFVGAKYAAPFPSMVVVFANDLRWPYERWHTLDIKQLEKINNV